MNGKKIACVVLMSIIGAIIYFVQIIHQKTDAKRHESEAAVSEATSAQNALSLAEINTEKLRAETEELRRFITSWTTYAQRTQTQGEVEESILGSLRNSNLLILSQKFELKQSPTTPVIPKIVRASLVVEDQYARTLNWLGELERRLPMARLTSCHLTGGNTSNQIRAELSMEVPLANMSYTPPAAKAPADKGKPKPKA